MMEYKQIGMIVAALTAFIIFYKRFLERDGDAQHKPAVLIISAILLAGIVQTKRPFLEKHGSTIFSIVICLLAVVVFTNIYESVSDDSGINHIFRIDDAGIVTKE